MTFVNHDGEKGRERGRYPVGRREPTSPCVFSTSVRLLPLLDTITNDRNNRVHSRNARTPFICTLDCRQSKERDVCDTSVTNSNICASSDIVFAAERSHNSFIYDCQCTSAHLRLLLHGSSYSPSPSSIKFASFKLLCAVYFIALERLIMTFLVEQWLPIAIFLVFRFVEDF